MTDLQSWVAPTYSGLADLLAAAAAEAWDVPSLCEGWQVRHVVAHVTMPARLTPEQFGAEMAAAGGDFTRLSDTVAGRDATLPVTDHLAALRSTRLHGWQPPGGGAAGALSHAVIHSLDVTIALDRPAVAPDDAVIAVLDQLTAANGATFGLDLTGVRLEAADTDWRWGSGEVVRAESGRLAALLSGRTLSDGRVLRRGGRAREGNTSPAARSAPLMSALSPGSPGPPAQGGGGQRTSPGSFSRECSTSESSSWSCGERRPRPATSTPRCRGTRPAGMGALWHIQAHSAPPLR